MGPVTVAAAVAGVPLIKLTAEAEPPSNSVVEIELSTWSVVPTEALGKKPVEMTSITSGLVAAGEAVTVKVLAVWNPAMPNSKCRRRGCWLRH